MTARLLLGTRKGLFIYSRSAGGKWEITSSAHVGDPVTMLLHDRRDHSLYAGLSLGHFGCKMHRSDDLGTTWMPVAVPAYPVAAEGHTGANLEYIWSLETDGNQTPGALWCGTIPGGLFRSRDRAQSWELVTSLWENPKRAQWMGGGMEKPGIHSICVHPEDSRQITLGVSCGGVWESRDAGETWNCRATGMIARYMPPERQDDPNVQDPHRLVQSPTNPHVFWVQHHNGIFRTTDAATSWHEIMPRNCPSFGFAVAVHPHDPDTAWFVPAQSDQFRVPAHANVIVSRTRDGGKTFDVLTDGLPKHPAYHIVYRHCLDVDDNGSTLAIASTTGSLWLSENAGDSWERLTADLPPVYCVRFSKW